MNKHAVMLSMKMFVLAKDYLAAHSIDVHQSGNEMQIHAVKPSLEALIGFYVGIVNETAAYRNTNKNHTSALAAIKRIRRVLGLKGHLGS